MQYLIFTIFWLAVTIFIYVKFDKEHRISFYEKYYESLPGNYSPGEVSILVYYDQIGPLDIMATLFNLVAKGYLLITVKEGLVFKVNENAPAEGAEGHEAYLLNWLMGREGYLSIPQLEKISASPQEGKAFAEGYVKWRKVLKEDADKNGFFADRRPARILGGGMGILYMAVSLFFLVRLNVGSSVFMAVLGACSIMYSRFVYKRTRKGLEQYEKWMAFKRFLKDFDLKARRCEDTIETWEQYLIYGISLGVFKEVASIIPGLFNGEDRKNPRLKLITAFYSEEEGLASLGEALLAYVKAIEGALSGRSI